MSLVLDALRRGRARITPRSSSNAARTDAVLRTLGYGHFSPGSRLSKFKRIAGYFVLGIVLAIVMWAGMFWVMEL